jgi:hypothetical protein
LTEALSSFAGYLWLTDVWWWTDNKKADR